MGASEHFVSLYVHLSPLECNFFVTIDALLTLSFVADDGSVVEGKGEGSLLKGAEAACRWDRYKQSRAERQNQFPLAATGRLPAALRRRPPHHHLVAAHLQVHPGEDAHGQQVPPERAPVGALGRRRAFH